MSEFDSQGKNKEVLVSPIDGDFLNAEWLASLSHELRSPLAAIQGYTSLLLRYDLHLSREDHQEFLQAIREGSDRMAVVLDRFFDLAQLEAGAVQLHLAPLNIVQLVQDAVRMYRLGVESPLVENKCISLVVREEGAEPVGDGVAGPFMIMGDQALLQKMLFHLLDNAYKYAPAESAIEITIASSVFSRLQSALPPQVSAHMPLKGVPFVDVSIRDQGIGIASTDQRRIFERFQRVDLALNRSITGLGLGLTISKAIVDLHQGIIWVESVPEVGSTFHIVLPVMHP
jgi:signal transduction histidine kinase